MLRATFGVMGHSRRAHGRVDRGEGGLLQQALVVAPGGGAGLVMDRDMGRGLAVVESALPRDRRAVRRRPVLQQPLGQLQKPARALARPCRRHPKGRSEAEERRSRLTRRRPSDTPATIALSRQSNPSNNPIAPPSDSPSTLSHQRRGFSRDVELPAHCQRRDAHPDRAGMSADGIRAAGDLHAKRIHGGESWGNRRLTRSSRK